ncbi:MAG: RNA-directed DNA polymerase, partial [Methylococcales bacterium]|nr:RNA-directed DNA polymerase [Methylococcales bacterium]
RSIVSNARPHIGQAVVINLDLQNFFPSINYRRIKGLFKSLGYSESIATVLALLCSEPQTDDIELDNELWYAANGERHLPQGAPSSPAISNLIVRALDRRMQGIADRLGFCYSRYADDMTFSGNKAAAEHLTKLFWHIRRIVQDEGFTLHPDKTRIMRQGSRQEVTGLVVNEQLSLDRKVLKRFRTLLFQIEKDGLEGKHWNGISGRPLLRSIRGYAHYIVMVNRDKGLPLKRRVDAICQQHGSTAVPRSKSGIVSRTDFRQRSAQGLPPWKGWWEPAVKAEPVREDTQAEMNERKKQEALQLNLSTQSTQDNEAVNPDESHSNSMHSVLDALETPLSGASGIRGMEGGVILTLLRRFFR